MGVVVVAGLVGWAVLGFLGTARMRDERDAGYATAADVPGLELRDARTGQLLRARDVDPAAVETDPRPLIARLLRVPPGSLLERVTRDEEPPRA